MSKISLRSSAVVMMLLFGMLCLVSSTTALSCKGKSSWPELVGKDGKVAAKIIEKQNPFVRAIVLPEGSPVTFDLRCDRVWVFVSKTNGKVVKTPIIT